MIPHDQLFDRFEALTFDDVVIAGGEHVRLELSTD